MAGGGDGVTWTDAYAPYDEAALVTLANPGLVRRASKLAAEAQWVGEVTDRGVVKVGDVEVRLDTKGPQGARCPCPTAGTCVHILAGVLFLRAWVEANGGFPESAIEAEPVAEPKAQARQDNKDAPTEGPTDATRAVTAKVRDEIEKTASVGLSHLGQDAADRIFDLAIEARAAGLALLGRNLTTASALIDGLVERRDDVDERQAIASLARAWGLAAALDAAGASGSSSDDWVRLRGSVRREFTTQDHVTLLPLGATWWVTASGARGLTLTTWDAEAGELRSATSARPGGTDAGFIRSREMTALWGAPLSTLLRGSFRLDGPRMASDGSLSATARHVTQVVEGYKADVLRGIAENLTPERPTVGLADTNRPVALVAVDGFGEIAFDEPGQQMVWSVPVGGRVWHLRQEITKHTSHRIDELLRWNGAKLRPEFLLARRAVIGGQAVWEPATAFVPFDGGLRMLTVDFARPLATHKPSVLQKRWEMLRSRWQTMATAPPVTRSAVEKVLDDIRDMIVDLVVTGRLTPSARQAGRLSELAAKCDEMALATVAKTMRSLVSDPGPIGVLRLQLVTDRAADIASAFGDGDTAS